MRKYNQKLFDKVLDEAVSKSFRIIKSKLIKEGLNNDNYSHFAVNKNTNLIVNGWDYNDYDNSELRQFKKDYFINDLIDNGFDPKEYKILTLNGCKRAGINPDDDNNWSNDGINHL